MLGSASMETNNKFQVLKLLLPYSIRVFIGRFLLLCWIDSKSIFVLDENHFSYLRFQIYYLFKSLQKLIELKNLEDEDHKFWPKNENLCYTFYSNPIEMPQN